MKRPQFSLKVLLIMVAFMGVGLALVIQGITATPDDLLRASLFLPGLALFGAALGIPYGRPIYAAFLFTLVVWALLSLVGLLFLYA